MTPSTTGVEAEKALCRFGFPLHPRSWGQERVVIQMSGRAPYFLWLCGCEREGGPQAALHRRTHQQLRLKTLRRREKLGFMAGRQFAFPETAPAGREQGRARDAFSPGDADPVLPKPTRLRPRADSRVTPTTGRLA